MAQALQAAQAGSASAGSSPARPTQPGGETLNPENLQVSKKMITSSTHFVFNPFIVI